jgi:hypothetical protein
MFSGFVIAEVRCELEHSTDLIRESQRTRRRRRRRRKRGTVVISNYVFCANQQKPDH